jgi:hypothetical protein
MECEANERRDSSGDLLFGHEQKRVNAAEELKRQVATKVLPAAMATDAERLARFQREAESSINPDQQGSVETSVRRLDWRIDMSWRKTVLIGAMWLGSLTVAALVGRAQVLPVQPVTPFVVSGADVGFRVEGQKGSTPVGYVVVRKDATSPWTPVELKSYYARVRPAE